MIIPPGSGLDADVPFLVNDPPHWVARGLSTVLLVLFVVTVVAAVVVRVPETVAGPFVLVPEHGADPVRAAREGTVAEVRVSEGQAVTKGATLFVIRSQAVGDRSADIRGLEMQQAGTDQRLANARAENESRRRADDLEARRLEARLASLERVAALKQKQLATTRSAADRWKRGEQQGLVGAWDADRLALDVDRLSGEVESATADQAETRTALAKLRQDTTTRAVQFRELIRGLEQEREMAKVRLESTRGQLAGGGAAAGDLVVSAPCDGTVLRMMVSTATAIVQAGDALGEIACAGDRLEVEMTLGQQAVARVRVGQGAKLLYDAFPYQRFGVKEGRVRWVGPATTVRAPGTRYSGPVEEGAFRALIDGRDSAIMVGGEPRPLLVGMRGRAQVVTGRRSLISFAFEPIRALRENLSAAGVH